MITKGRQTLIDELIVAGIEILSLRQKRHVVACCRTPDGRKFSIPLSASGDRRAVKNYRAQIKKHKQGKKK
jgi:hypothetical protein